jgi:hypothetical protein
LRFISLIKGGGRHVVCDRGPEFLTAAASDLAGIGSAISAASAAAAAPTTGVLAAGADEVSAAIASIFDTHAQAYQALSAQAATFHQQFVHLMSADSGAYATAENSNASNLPNLGIGNKGNANLSNGNTGRGNVGGGNYGDSNLGGGNFGSQNVGSGNDGSGNFGGGNIGVGNIGKKDIGFGLTGNNLVGIGNA